MNSYQKEYTLIAPDQDYFANDVTGASWTISTNATPNGEAYKVAILNNSGTDHSGKTAIIVGLDADGQAQTETVTLPEGSSTIYSSGYYSYITSVTPSATIGSDTMDIGTSAYFASKTFPLTTDKTASLALDIISGSMTFTGECSYNEVSTTSAPYIWQDLTESGQDFYQKTASNNTFLLSPPPAFRVVTDTFTGTPNFRISIVNNFARG